MPITGSRSRIHKTIQYNTKLQGSGKPVEVTFQPSGKVIMAEQGDKIEDIAKKNGVTIPFKCKQVLLI